MNTGAGKTGARLVTTSKTSLRDWEKLLDGLTPYVTVIFSKDLFSRILSFNAPLKAVNTYTSYAGSNYTDVERCSMSVQALLFRLQRTDKKFQYLDDIGKLHSDLKFSVVRNVFCNVHLDSFGLFKANGHVPIIETGAATRDAVPFTLSKGKIERTSWLEKGFVSSDHIMEARAFTETSGQSRKEKVRRKPTQDDIACHGALRLYRQLGKVLHDGRGSMRVAFFQGLGYLFFPWKGRVTDVDQGSLRLKFLDDVTNLCLDDVPSAQQCAQNADETTVSTADASKKRMLKEIFCRHDMILTVYHEVMVSTSGQQKSDPLSDEKKVIHRLLNMVDVALDCCVEFCRVWSRELFMRSSKNSFRCVMLFAKMFKALIVEFMEMSNVSLNSGAASFPEPTDVKVYGICLKDLIPGLTTQKSLLRSKCVHISHALYGALNHVSSDTGSVMSNYEDVAGTDVLDIRKIEESVEEGICML